MASGYVHLDKQGRKIVDRYGDALLPFEREEKRDNKAYSNDWERLKKIADKK